MTTTRNTARTESPLGAALVAAGLEDFQPDYRKLLVGLKQSDPAAYEEAVERYRDQVESVDADGPSLIGAWLEYGAWLAQRRERGRAHAIDANGLARPVDGSPPVGPLLVHLPEDARTRGFVLAMPADASEAQRESAALLCQ